MNILSHKLGGRVASAKLMNLTYMRSAPFSFNFYDIPFSTDMNFVKNHDKIKAFRVMDEDGKIINKKYENIEKDKLLKIFKTMVGYLYIIRLMD